MVESRRSTEPAEHDHLPDRRILTFVGVMSAMFLSALDQTIVGVSMPRIIKELNGFDRYTWVTTVYLLTSAAVVPVVGKLSEQLGRKRVFLVGIAMFLVGSALAGASQSLDQLILFRGFQGIGGGVLTGTAFAIIADLFSPAERGKYTGFMVGVFGLASILGPLAGGYLTDNVGWRWIFYVNLPIGLVIWTALLYTFPSRRRPVARPRIDYVGATGISGGAALMVMGTSLAGVNGWIYFWVWPCISGGAAMIAAAMWHESRTPEAVLPPALFKSSIVSLSMAVTFIFGAVMLAAITYVPLFLQAVVGVSSTYSGLLMLPMMAGLIVGATGGGFLLSHTGRYRIQGLAGITAVTTGMYLLSRLNVTATQAEVGRDLVVVGLGLGISTPVLHVISQNAVPQRFVSSATSALQFIRQMGGTLGLAVLGAIFAQNYKSNLISHMTLAQQTRAQYMFGDALFNPQKLFDLVPQRLATALPQDKLFILGVLNDVKLGLTQAMVHGFLITAVFGVVALVFTALIKEIPLRRAIDEAPPPAPPGPEAATTLMSTEGVAAHSGSTGLLDHPRPLGAI
ncbi:MAG TPA: MDR family MFS transporter [Steroidobacteraceae bacterium]|jgi:EmrB/QacA subfamily drug resistance transporter|nr:MDR family MFS transporter [Steroidobacteraceae bacterium]